MLKQWMKVLCSWRNRQHQNLKTSSKVSCQYNNDLWHTDPVPWPIVNPLTPNDLYIHRALSPLNSRTTYIYVVNSMSKFGGILFTPIRLTAMAHYASGPMKVRLSFRSQNVPPPPPKLLHKHQYVCRHLVTVHFSQLTNTVVTLCALIITCSGVHCGLKYQHWPIKWRLSVLYCTHIIKTKLVLKNGNIHKTWCLQLQVGPQTCLL